MKKIFTIILAAAGTFSFASAQSFNGKNVVFNGHKKVVADHDQRNSYGDTNSVNYNDAKFTYRQKQAKIAAINGQFDQQIAFVKNNRRLNNREKNKQIQVLQNERNNEIKKLDFQYAATDHKSDSRNGKSRF